MATNATSLTSATSPPAQDVKPTIIRRPSLIMKPAQSPAAAASPPSNSATTPMSLTSKEWIIPPRPKPGRKPATDTPPSKRKAQNRAAQRAFRERRAARVNELEDQMKQIEDENEREQDELRAHITKLEQSLEQFRAEMMGWMERCRRLESDLAATRGATGTNSKTDVVGDTSVGCGKCTLESRCQCIDDAFDAINGTSDPSPTEKRPHSPRIESSEKRIKLEPHESLEIDFTNTYSKQASRAATSRSLADHVPSTTATAHALPDPCGFCSDGTPCICAEMAAEQGPDHHGPPSLSRSHPSNISQFTPPPSEGDVNTAPPLIPALPSLTTIQSASCINGPGTCTQCQSDPNSTLFCKSLAASRPQSTMPSTNRPDASGCCGAGTPGGGCCQDGTSSQTSAAAAPRLRATRSRASANSAAAGAPAQPKASITLTCADAYTTLSRHPGYEKASAEIASWMPNLHASDAASSGHGQDGPTDEANSGDCFGRERGRPAMEIDAANVMAVLKDFDRRFGKNC